MNGAVDLPRVLNLISLERPDSARAEAERLARKGADEGTMIWARGQREGRGRGGNTWMSGHKNLHCALILRPGLPLAECCQLSLLASVACSVALAQQAEPLVELRYRWPNDVLLNRGKVAGVTLSGELNGNSVNWLVLGLNVNVFEHPASKGFEAASMRGEGFAEFDREALLSAYGRAIASWLGRWSDEGFAPVRDAWLTRGSGKNLDYRLNIKGASVSGVFTDLTDSGDLSITNDAGEREIIKLVDFFSADFEVGETSAQNSV